MYEGESRVLGRALQIIWKPPPLSREDLSSVKPVHITTVAVPSNLTYV